MNQFDDGFFDDNSLDLFDQPIVSNSIGHKTSPELEKRIQEQYEESLKYIPKDIKVMTRKKYSTTLKDKLNAVQIDNSYYRKKYTELVIYMEKKGIKLPPVMSKNKDVITSEYKELISNNDEHIKGKEKTKREKLKTRHRTELKSLRQEIKHLRNNTVIINKTIKNKSVNYIESISHIIKKLEKLPYDGFAKSLLIWVNSGKQWTERQLYFANKI